MEREQQLEMLKKLIQAHIKRHLFLHLQYQHEELLAMGLSSLSKCLAKKVNPDVLIEKLEWEGRKKVLEYSKMWAEKIVKDYEQKLRS